MFSLQYTENKLGKSCVHQKQADKIKRQIDPDKVLRCFQFCGISDISKIQQLTRIVAFALEEFHELNRKKNGLTCDVI